MSLPSKTKRDILLAIGLLLAAGIAALFLYLFRTDGGRAVVVIDGVETASYALSEDVTVTLSCPEGSNTLVIQDGKADIIAADCPDALCVDQRSICYDGETIVCLPHKLVIKIESDERGEVDVML